VFCANSLVRPDEWPPAVRAKIKLDQFNVVLTNPPFGKKIVVKGQNILSQYNLAYSWKRDKQTKEWVKTDELPEESPPQIPFLERCLQLLKPGGKLGIVLPESVLGNPSYESVIAYILRRCRVLMIVTLPESLFKTSGKGGTHTKVCVMVLENQPTMIPYDIFMAEAKWCGHDSRGNPTIRKDASGKEVLLDDTPAIAEKWKLFAAGKDFPADHLGYLLSSEKIKNAFWSRNITILRLMKSFSGFAERTCCPPSANWLSRKFCRWRRVLRLGRWPTGPEKSPSFARQTSRIGK
jgi:type I restriction enzyme M protein